MFTVAARYTGPMHGSSKTGYGRRADAEAHLARLSGTPSVIECRILEGVTIPGWAIVKAAKQNARCRRRDRHGAWDVGWTLSGVLGRDALWSFDDEAAVGARSRAILARYDRFVHHVREVAPGWQEVERLHYADNSIVAVQRATDGRTRNVTLLYPGGDACF